MKVVCISGKAQHGKDTMAQMMKRILEDSYGKSVLIIRYADQLKFILREYYDWDGVKDERGRSLMQTVGTDLARKADPDIWVKYVMRFLAVFGTDFDYVLIPDCRFTNEIEYPKSHIPGTVSVRVIRPGFDNGLTGIQKAHASETELDDYDFDYVVENTSFVALSESARKIIEDFEKS